MPSLEPAKPFLFGMRTTQRSDISGIGFRHMPSAVARHFGESCIDPPVIVPVPSEKRTREVVRPSSISICQGRPSATLAANVMLEPASRVDAAVNCIVAPAIMTSTHAALPKAQKFERGDDEPTNEPGFTGTISFALIAVTSGEPTVRSAPCSQLKFAGAFFADITATDTAIQNSNLMAIAPTVRTSNAPPPRT